MTGPIPIQDGLFSKAKVQVLIWKLTILLFFLFSLDAIFTAFVSVMIDISWSDLSGTQRWIRVALIGKAWASAMIAFFTNAQRKIRDNEFPGANPGDTTFIQQTQITSPKTPPETIP